MSNYYQLKNNARFLILARCLQYFAIVHPIYTYIYIYNIYIYTHIYIVIVIVIIIIVIIIIYKVHLLCCTGGNPAPVYQRFPESGGHLQGWIQTWPGQFRLFFEVSKGVQVCLLSGGQFFQNSTWKSYR